MKVDKDMTVEQFLEQLDVLTDRLHNETRDANEAIRLAFETQREIAVLQEQFSTLVKVRKDLGLEPPK